MRTRDLPVNGDGTWKDEAPGLDLANSISCDSSFGSQPSRSETKRDNSVHTQRENDLPILCSAKSLRRLTASPSVRIAIH